MKLECPKCQSDVAVPDADPGAVVECPACQRKFRVPFPASSSHDEFPLPFRIFMVVLGLVGLFFPLAAMTTPGKSAGMVAGLGLTLLAVWKRHAIDQYFKQRQRRSAEKRAEKQLAAQAASDEQSAAGTDEQPAADADAAAAPQVTPTQAAATMQQAASAVLQAADTPAAPAGPVAHIASPSANSAPGVAPRFGAVLDTLLKETAQDDSRQSERARISPPEAHATSTPVSQPPNVPPPAFPPHAARMPDEAATSSAPQRSPDDPEADSLTAGLPEKYRAFLEAAMTQSRWPREELAAAASAQHLDWNEAYAAINQWARERFGDPLLVDDDDDVRVQLPML